MVNIIKESGEGKERGIGTMKVDIKRRNVFFLLPLSSISHSSSERFLFCVSPPCNMVFYPFLPALSHVAARKIVRRSVLGPVRDIALLLTRAFRNQPKKQKFYPIGVKFGVLSKSSQYLFHITGLSYVTSFWFEKI